MVTDISNWPLADKVKKRNRTNGVRTAPEVAEMIEQVKRDLRIEVISQWIELDKRPSDATPGDKTYPMDKWRVTLQTVPEDGYQSRSMEIDYWTGTGYRRKVDSPTRADHGSTYPMVPDPLGILYCLLSDSSACDQSFEDWCFELGYDEDSRRAEATYRKCQEIGYKFKALFDLDKLRSYPPLEDY